MLGISPEKDEGAMPRPPAVLIVMALTFAACGDTSTTTEATVSGASSAPATSSDTTPAPATSITTTAVADTAGAPTTDAGTTTAPVSAVSLEELAAELAAVESCEELADLEIRIFQAALDVYGAVSLAELESQSDAFQATFSKFAEFADEGEATAQRLGCLDPEALILLCERLDRLDAHGEAGEVLIEELGYGCPATLDDEVLAASGLGETVALPTDLTLPADLEIGAGALWVADFGGGRLLKVDSMAGRVVAGSEYVGAFGVAVAPDGVWFTNVDGNYVTHVDFEANTIRSVDVGTAPGGVTFGTNSIWVVNSDDATVSRIDPETHDVVATIPVGTVGLGFPAFGGGLLWVPDFTANVVYRVDPITNSTSGEPIAVGAGPVRLAVGGDVIWVANRDDGTASGIDIASGEATTTIAIADTISAIAADGIAVWVATEDGLIVRVDSATLEQTQLATVPGFPVDVAADEESTWVLWVDEDDAGFVSRVP